VPDPALLRRRRDGVILEANRAFAGLLGEPREELLGEPLAEIDLEFLGDEREGYLEALRGEGEVRDVPIHVAAGGTRRLQLISSRLVEYRGEPCILSVAKDITDREEAQRRLEASERRYRRLFERNVAGTFRTALDGTILECNQAFAEMFGFDSPEEAQGRSARELYATPGERNGRMERLREEDALVGAELELERRDGSRLWVLENSFLVDDGDGQPENMGTLVDITDRKQLEGRLERMAHRDSLTGLANRRRLREEAEQAIARADREGQRVGLIFLDLARFKRVNDTLGHAAGDEVLVMAAKRLESSMREADLAARVGGDEFAALVPGVEAEEDLRRVAERFDIRFSDPFRVEDATVHLDLRMGLALYPDHGSNFSELLSCADYAMYEADLTGGDPIAVYESVMGPGPEGGLAREEALRTALERDELTLHYQPIYGAEDEALRGAEALVRWRHPEAGLLSAAEFVPLAERSGLIRRLDEWVLRAAVRQIAAWEEAGDGPEWLSVNLSASSLASAELADFVGRLLDEADVPGERLAVEITERVALRDPEEVSDTLDRLRAQGVRVAVDDFGTGHAVLAYLRQFVANILKLDMVFVQQMEEQPRDEELVAGITALGRQLDMEVVAEGVESGVQRDRLRAVGVDLVQGYWLGRPVPPDELPPG
jgi:diguanylate cyclase (GGDEF)-like protein/PAS domain S-box-containing protein